MVELSISQQGLKSLIHRGAVMLPVDKLCLLKLRRPVPLSAFALHPCAEPRQSLF